MDRPGTGPVAAENSRRATGDGTVKTVAGEPAPGAGTAAGAQPTGGGVAPVVDRPKRRLVPIHAEATAAAARPSTGASPVRT